MECFVPHEESVLYEAGAEVNKAKTDEGSIVDFFGHKRNVTNPSIGFAECGSIHLIIMMILMITMII